MVDKRKSKCYENCSCSEQIRPIIQKPAPNFTAKCYFKKKFKPISLDDFKGKYLVLFFYPLDFTFVCPTEIIQFSNMAKTFQETNCEVVGCSVDSQFAHMEYCKKQREKGGLGDMDIPLISDITKKISKDYGVLIETGEDAGIALRFYY